MEEAKALEEDIDSVRSKVDDPQICEKVKLFVYAPPEIQAIYKADAGMSCHEGSRIAPSHGLTGLLSD